MRRSWKNGLSAVLGAALAALGLGTVSATLAGTASASASTTVAASSGYTWKNAAVVGGGFVPDIVFNEGAQNVIYARTDIGGMYRWNQGSSSWTPLTDWVGWNNWNQQGIVSIAADPVQTNRVYAAVGMYTNGWDPNNGAILRSTDQGSTWTATALPFKLGGNMPGRGMGERLMVDPNDDAVLYMGMPSGHGLWKSADYGVTWAQVSGFTNVGDYVQDSTDTTGYLSDNQGVTWVAFDTATEC